MRAEAALLVSVYEQLYELVAENDGEALNSANDSAKCSVSMAG